MTCCCPLDLSQEAKYNKWDCFKSPTHRDSSLTASEVSTAVTQCFQINGTSAGVLDYRFNEKALIDFPSFIASLAWVLLGTGFIFSSPLKLGRNMPLIGESLSESMPGISAAFENILWFCIVMHNREEKIRLSAPDRYSICRSLCT